VAAVDPPRQSEAEARAFRLLGLVLIDLRKAERALVRIYDDAPDPERAVHLAAVRETIARLHLIFASQN
jgi:hypothetical protein